MRFGKCYTCNEYKYLVDGESCNSCRENSNSEDRIEDLDPDSWVVTKKGYLPGKSRTIYKKGLREKQAKSIAREKTYLSAHKVSEITIS